MFYSLVSYLTLRKEWFGVLISNPRTGEFHQFDHDALILLELLQKPITFDAIKTQSLSKGFILSDDDLNEFLQDLIRNDIVTTDLNNQGCNIMYLNEEVPLNYLVAPSSVTIYITQFCTKACRHCVTKSHSKVDDNEECNITEWKKILLSLKKIGIMGLVFTGGEPLSKPGIFELLDFADSLDFKISLLTDLDGIDSVTIEKLKSLNNLSDLQTSLDGSNAESHDFIRGIGSFENTLKRLEVLSNSGIEYTISCSVNTLNISEIDEIADIANRFRASYLYLNPVAPYGRAKETMAGYLLDENQLFELAHKYLEIIGTKQIDPGNPFWTENLDKIWDQSFNPFKDSLNAVSLGIYNFSIDQKGECYLDSKMKAEGVLYLGNACSENVAEMWHSRKLDFLRNASSQGKIFIDIAEI